LYYEPNQLTAFAGAYHTLKKVSTGIDDKRKIKNRAKEWFDEQDTYTLHKNVLRKFPRRPYNVFNIDDVWEIDLADFRSLRSYNDGITYVLFVIDVLSKYLWVRPLKNKSANVVAEALRSIFLSDTHQRLPVFIQSDKGLEFTARSVRDVLKKFNEQFREIRNPDAKAAVVERVIQTIKHRLWRYFTYKNTRRFVDGLPIIVESYNNTLHSSIKMTPASVNIYNADQAAKNLVKRYWPKKFKNAKYKVGTLVRISRAPVVFRKVYEGGWTIELFKIHNVSSARQPPVYTLKDLNGDVIDGIYYEQELCRVKKNLSDALFEIDKILETKGRGKSKKYFVSWKGYPPNFNSWIPASDIVDLKS